MIIDGWFDFAIRTPAPTNKTNGGVNKAREIFLHSAEGYAPHLLDLAVNGPLSWHFSNLINGGLHQHYPLTAQCWHASAANNWSIGMENEGTFGNEPTLNEAQIANAVRVIRELSEWKGWEPRRPANATEVGYTLWEHNEVTKVGGSATACPSGRIPWDEILRRLAVPNPNDGWHQVDNYWFLMNNGIDVLKIGDVDGQFPGRFAKNFGGVWWWLRKAPLSQTEHNLAAAWWTLEEGD